MAGAEVVDFDVPGLPVQRFVVVNDELGCLGASGNNLAGGTFVVERSDDTGGDFNGEMAIGELEHVFHDFF